MADYLRAAGYPRDDLFVERALIGAIVGFAPPAIAMIVSLVLRWVGSGKFARLASRAGARALDPDAAIPTYLYEAVWSALLEAPVPPILYRKAQPHAVFRPGEPVAPGSCVVVGLQSASLDDGANEPVWLFGGEHGGATHRNNPVHGCPARQPAVGAIVGIVAALLQYPKLKQEGVLTISA
jgi:hypothetical protein